MDLIQKKVYNIFQYRINLCIEKYKKFNKFHVINNKLLINKKKKYKNQKINIINFLSILI